MSQFITHQGWSLYFAGTSTLVTVGASVHTTDQVPSDPDRYTITGGRPPHKPGSTGRVWYEIDGATGEFFPSVFGMEWRQDNVK